MLTLLGSLLGLLGSIAPEVVRCFQDKRDHAHELALFKLQLKMHLMDKAQHREDRLEELRAYEMAKLYTHAAPTNISWVDALSGSVRPVITYTFFLLYAAVKVAQACTLLHIADHLQWSQALIRIWHEEDQALFAAVMAFWFGQRALRHGIGHGGVYGASRSNGGKPW